MMSVEEQIGKHLEENPEAVMAGFEFAVKVLGAFLDGMKEAQAARGVGPVVDATAEEVA